MAEGKKRAATKRLPRARGKAGAGGLTPKQAMFVQEYLIDLNATQAAVRAGYSAKTANEQGSRLLTNVSVHSAIAEAQKQRSIRTGITADRVLQELARIAFFDIRKLFDDDGSLKKPHELDDDAAAVLAGIDTQTSSIPGAGNDQEAIMSLITKKAKVFDKNTALTLAMRHLGMLNDKLEHSGAPMVIVKDYTGRG